MVTDRFFGPYVAFAINVITALGVFLLARAMSFPTGCLPAALIGVGAGGEAATTPSLLTRYFGLRAFSTLYGVTWTFYAVAGAIGPVILGARSTRPVPVPGCWCCSLSRWRSRPR